MSDGLVKFGINLRCNGDSIVPRSSMSAVAESHLVAALRVEAMLETVRGISSGGGHRLTRNERCRHVLLVVVCAQKMNESIVELRGLNDSQVAPVGRESWSYWKEGLLRL
jgi:hypothetical protein